MNVLRSIPLIIAATGAALTLTACNTPSPEPKAEYAAPVAKGDSKDTVLGKLGRPTSVLHTNGQERWIYVASNARKLDRDMHARSLVPIVGPIMMYQYAKSAQHENSMVQVTFSASGRVASVNRTLSQTNMLNRR
ncbi:MAG: outer membrane protein assembly factor BamE [Verrucomicrobiales bacterium]|nr:outer membrane protein assembly factor BamE [Verrucomicrobiales bacterium]MCP5560005.1 outer membrane protein assembly factor BamE [Verrucomicrobiaceae bacterium]